MKKIFFAFAVAVLGLSSCNLEPIKTEPTPIEVNYYAQNRFSQHVFNDVVTQVLDLTQLQVDNSSGNALPVGVVISPIVDNVMTIEYNEQEKSGRLGKIKVSFTGVPLAEGSAMHIEPDGLKYAGLRIEGAIDVNILPKGVSKAKQSISIVHATLVDGYNAEIVYSCSLIREQQEGASKLDADDTFTFTGSSSGIFSSKTSYTMSIVDPMVIYYGSSYFNKGKLSIIAAPSSSPFYIEFGKGQYVNEVLLTRDGTSKLYNI